MRFRGKVYKEGGWWLARVSLFDAMSQGRSRKEALEMIADWFETLADVRGFRVRVHGRRGGEFEVGSKDVRTLVRLLLRRRRQKSGLSLNDAAQRLGARSRNAYARYERGEAVPSVEKLDELLRALSPETDFVLCESEATYG